MHRTAGGPLQVTLYGRPGCHLCDEAEATLRRIARDLPVLLTVVDIEGDEALLRRYLFEIPVVTVDGSEVARAPISPVRLQAELAARANPDG